MARSIILGLLGAMLITGGALAAEQPTAELEGYSGWWLQNDVAEAFVIAEPYPRIISFRLQGGDSPLHISHEYEYFGIRSWFLEPTQIDESGLPALQPAEAEKLGPRALRLTAAEEEKSGLQLIMEISLDESAAQLRVRHGFKNLRQEQRRIAAWALNVIRPDRGVGITPWRSQELRSLLLWPATDPTEKGLHFGPRAIALDYRVLPENKWQKLGTNTDAGWVAFVWDGQALKSTVAYVPNAEYPEGGGTVTMFNSTPELFEAGERFGEIENIGPLYELLPGHTLWLDQTLELVAGVEGDDPEKWLEVLEAK